MQMQNIMFDKKKWTTQQARSFMMRNKIKPIKRVDITNNYYRYRLIDPKYFKKGTFRTITLSNKKKIKAVVGIRK